MIIASYITPRQISFIPKFFAIFQENNTLPISINYNGIGELRFIEANKKFDEQDKKIIKFLRSFKRFSLTYKTHH
jgi:hypothetical protein